MPADRAARNAEFLAQHLADLRRPAPHLRRPALMERQARLEALLSVFMEQHVDLQEEEQQWCRSEWGNIRPFLETMGETEEGSEEEEGLDPSGAQGQEQELMDDHQIVAIEDSQEAVEEGGSQVQVARLSNGSVRDMLPEEVEMMQWAETIEAEAAEEERRREQEMWGVFSSASYTSWEQWSLANQDAGPEVKRARVQIRIQGEGGRVVRDEHYMVALRDGEQLAYQVSVRSPHVEREDKGVYVEQAEEHMASEAARSSGQASDPGEEAGQVTEEDREQSQTGKDHIDVAEFVASPLGKKFYEEWKAGRAGSQIIGQRFGYGVLGAFASMWEDEKEAREMAGQQAEAGNVEGESGRADVVAAGADDREGDDPALPDLQGRRQESFKLRPPPEEPLQIVESQESGASGSDLVVVLEGHGDEVQAGGHAAAADVAASSSITGASVSGSSTAEGSGRRVQTDLKKWLL